jgi:hypothetical protein
VAIVDLEYRRFGGEESTALATEIAAASDVPWTPSARE